jgi:hypothetical protein
VAGAEGNREFFLLLARDAEALGAEALEERLGKAAAP